MRDQRKFLETIQCHFGIIRKAATIYVSQKEDVEDLTQEIIYQLWKSFESFEKKSAISTWIYRVSMNVAIQNLKQHKKGPKLMPIDSEIINVVDPNADDHYSKIHALHAKMKDLNVLERGIVMLYLEGKSYVDIADIIGISESNVGTKLNRIKKKLRGTNSK